MGEGEVTDQLLSLNEVAELTGIAPESISRYLLDDRQKDERSFPKPDKRFGKSPAWLRTTIEAYLETRRGPGRPKSEVVE